jgi:hypothetical protein
VVAVVLHHFGMAADSVETGSFEATSQLRSDDDEGDDLGAQSDDELGMGEAETWFREKSVE